MGDLEGTQLLEYFILLGKPSNSFFDRFPKLNVEIIKGLKEINEIVPYDIKKLFDPNKYYKKREIELAADLFKKLVCIDANERITAEEALKHEFFSV